MKDIEWLNYRYHNHILESTSVYTNSLQVIEFQTFIGLLNFRDVDQQG